MTIDKFNHQIKTGQAAIQSFAFVIAVIICLLVVIYCTIPCFEEFTHHENIELDSRINPNTAPAASLIRLPGIGISRANAIVTYRNNISSDNAVSVFENSNDLQKVKGIGPKTVKNINEHLKFE